ncbi:MAG: bifunctional diaminohydroxyphosphoribosylaminopyrimidine deaminase/5-amino-6-(5-phosphoribosylamino)uracil reductase RibD [Flavobacteriia bacterium]|nr:bifunctional diaminohydroxyphosphoribosylaminopyrimidine deaminase/5-amino-6-(5-phosphoribosylamino)uracil reductase RibD [Flavobacteriia bacterium]
MSMNEIYMQRCIDLARLGEGNVAPNPMVGAVIVWKDKIIGEGYHQKYGNAHAEVNAIQAVEDKNLLKEATMYVSLEPCAHFGKTPPCANLIVKHQLKKVVIGCVDTFSSVSGKGIKILQNAGIEVQIGVLEQECRELNKRFFTFHEKKRPYIILKWAQSKDGFMDKNRNENDKGVFWISAPETQVLVHQWRADEHSILVGRKTVEIDNPSLTVREVSGKNPIRIVIDSQLKSAIDSNIFGEEAPTIVLNKIKTEIKGNLEWIKLAELDTASILAALHERNIQSVFIEGGSKTLQHFLIDNVWDEARVIVGETIFKDGLKAPKIAMIPQDSFRFSKDRILIYKK